MNLTSPSYSLTERIRLQPKTDFRPCTLGSVTEPTVFSSVMFKRMAVRTEYLQVLLGVVLSVAVSMVNYKYLSVLVVVATSALIESQFRPSSRSIRSATYTAKLSFCILELRRRPVKLVSTSADKFNRSKLRLMVTGSRVILGESYSPRWYWKHLLADGARYLRALVVCFVVPHTRSRAEPKRVESTPRNVNSLLAPLALQLFPRFLCAACT